MADCHVNSKIFVQGIRNFDPQGLTITIFMLDPFVGTYSNLRTSVILKFILYMFLKTAKFCDFLSSCFTFHQFKYFKIRMKGPLCNLELILNPLDFAKSESRMEDTGNFSQELNHFLIVDKNHFLITFEFYDKSRNVNWQDFLAIYFKMVKLGDGLLCVSKAYVGARLLGLVSSSCLMVIPTKYYNTAQYLSVQPILLVKIRHCLVSGRDGSLSILLKVVRLSEAEFIQIFKAVRNVLRSGFVFTVVIIKHFYVFSFLLGALNLQLLLFNIFMCFLFYLVH